MRSIKRLPPVTEEMRERAKDLRKIMTKTEWKLWSVINAKQTGVKFLRQRPVGSYICDFISFEGGLVIEVDGSQHFRDKDMEYDKKRDEYLESLGFKVLRIASVDVMRNIEGVFTAIMQELDPPSPPPAIAGGAAR